MNSELQTRLLLKPSEAAKALAISERKLWELTHELGVIPCVRLGRSVRYSVRDLENWIEQQTAKDNNHGKHFA